MLAAIFWLFVGKFNSCESRMRLFLFAFLAMTAAKSLAATIVDQEFSGVNFNYYLDYPGDYMAQTFTVRNSGKLASVGVGIGVSGYPWHKPPVDDLYIKVTRSDASGAPAIDQVLASRSYSWTEVRDRTSTTLNFEVGSWNIPVTVGEVLAIVVSSNHTDHTDPNSHSYQHYTWRGQRDDPHPAGDFYLYSPKLYGPNPYKWKTIYVSPWPQPERPTVDMNFQVLVEEIPEPASLSMIACAIIGAQAWRRGTGGVAM